MEYPVRVIMDHIGAQLSGNGEEMISGVNALESARIGDLVFADDPKYESRVRQTCASAIIVSHQFPAVSDKNLLRVANPRMAFVKAMYLFQPEPPARQGIHPSATISPSARLGQDVTVGEHVVIRDHATVGQGTLIESGVHIGQGVQIGEQCRIGPNVVLMHGTRLGNRVILHGGTVIGGDGFGYVWVGDHHAKIPQLGNVVIEDDVEIGCNVCVDRATFGSTTIRRGTKIDNLVQIAHNDLIGQDVIITGQVGFAGSVTVGDRAMFGGQSGVVDHITIGTGAKIGAATPVTKDVRPGETVWGFPARPIQRVKRDLAGATFVPKLLQRVREIARDLIRMDARLGALERSKSSPAASDPLLSRSPR